MTPPTFANLGISDNPDINLAADAASYANDSWTPPTSGLIIVAVWSRNAAGPNEPTISGNGLTWEKIATVLASSVHRLTLFGANASGSSAGVTTVDFAGQTQIGCTALFSFADDVDLSGGVAAAFVQAVSNTGTNIQTLSITLAAASHADNRPFAAFSHAANEVTEPRTNWTELDDIAGAGPTRGTATQYRSDSFETTASASWASAVTALGIAVEIKGAAGGGITEDVNQTTETDTSQPITKRKSKTTGQNTETDTPQAIAAARRYPTGLNSEVDSAQPIAHIKIHAVAQNIEADSALAIAAGRLYPVGQNTETDSAQPITPRKVITLGQVAESNLSQPITARKILLVLQASETDEAGEITHFTGLLVQQVEETDIAQALFPLKRVAIAQAVEVEVAQPITPAKVRQLGQPSETDLSQALASAKVKAVGLAGETDLAQSITEQGPIIVALGQAVEVDTAFAITFPSGIETVDWTLKDRALAWLLPRRRTSWKLQERSLDWTVKE